MSEQKTLGQVCYDGYTGDMQVGRFTRDWSLLSENTRRHWQAAAEAVVRADRKRVEDIEAEQYVAHLRKLDTAERNSDGG